LNTDQKNEHRTAGPDIVGKIQIDIMASDPKRNLIDTTFLFQYALRYL